MSRIMYELWIAQTTDDGKLPSEAEGNVNVIVSLLKRWRSDGLDNGLILGKRVKSAQGPAGLKSQNGKMNFHGTL
jgi:hypothetical protein